MRSLVKREMHPAVWDSVNWELSTTYFTMATMQQDYAPLSRKAQEQVLKIMGVLLYNRFDIMDLTFRCVHANPVKLKTL